jgi:hypothetical protein
MTRASRKQSTIRERIIDGMDDKVRRGAYLSRYQPSGCTIVEAADAVGW